MSVYENHSVIKHLYLDKLRTLTPDTPLTMGRPRRFRLPSVSTSSSASSNKIAYAQVEFTLPPSESIELPTINPGNHHRPYRYAYGVNNSYSSGHGFKTTFADRIIKLDMHYQNSNHTTSTDTGGSKFWGIPGYTTSEPIFVPRPGGEDEDDGVVLSVVLDGTRGKSMLIILSAKTMEECARAEMETVFPIGFHGVWSQDQSAL